ncbi:YihA family ribosome biogenesis GTP-binding protein [Echinicola strongylocentroti]|uniref:Probable GTP-binding protein EngB n=1 Tax=Echinicola strongylocentroti TaxID=1795355 RepID=A0A2Z4IK49_9BACT|nr:ribosome biogenesis GTP-binding protein YihA/YsxC [Echinicola strongylocentroti]AWW31344.1 YihA family ribosome biogenesis GTP-binding protein [Echinicola strongylocentroti]
MIKKATFLTSNSDFRKCPEPTMPEFAFIGRSNVGKSSLINMLANNKNLAKTSGKPGKTQLINHFDAEGKWWIVDLPGYGFAQVSKSIKSDWEKMIKGYLTNRPNLIATFVLIDSRLEPQQRDLDFILWCAQNEVPIVLAFTKADKLSVSKVKGNVSKFLMASNAIFEEAPLYFVTSSTNAVGREEMVEFMAEQAEEFNAEK